MTKRWELIVLYLFFSLYLCFFVCGCGALYCSCFLSTPGTLISLLQQACLDPLWPRPPGLHFSHSLSFFYQWTLLGILLNEVTCAVVHFLVSVLNECWPFLFVCFGYLSWFLLFDSVCLDLNRGAREGIEWFH